MPRLVFDRERLERNARAIAEAARAHGVTALFAAKSFPHAEVLAIAREARESPDTVHAAPHTTPVGRVDEAGAARHPNLCWGGRCG